MYNRGAESQVKSRFSYLIFVHACLCTAALLWTWHAVICRFILKGCFVFTERHSAKKQIQNKEVLSEERLYSNGGFCTGLFCQSRGLQLFSTEARFEGTLKTNSLLRLWVWEVFKCTEDFQSPNWFFNRNMCEALKGRLCCFFLINSVAKQNGAYLSTPWFW